MRTMMLTRDAIFQRSIECSHLALCNKNLFIEADKLIKNMIKPKIGLATAFSNIKFQVLIECGGCNVIELKTFLTRENHLLD